MIDTVKHRPIEVRTDGGVEPYIVLPETQREEVTALLDANHVSYWVDEEVLSMDGGPEIAFITLDDRTDPTMVQQLLDSVP
jgi:hypothetical protein